MKKLLTLILILFLFFGLGFLFFRNTKESITYTQLYRTDDMLFVNLPDIKGNIVQWEEHSIFQHLTYFEGLNELSAQIEELSKTMEVQEDANLALIVQKDGELLLALDQEQDFSLIQSLVTKNKRFEKEIKGTKWYFLANQNLVLAATNPKVLDREIDPAGILNVNWNHLFIHANSESLGQKLGLKNEDLKVLFSFFKNFTYTMNLYDNKLVSSGFNTELNSKESKSLEGQRAVNFDMRDLIILNFKSLEIFQFDDGATYVKANDVKHEAESFYNTRFAEVSFSTSDKKDSKVYVLKSAETEALVEPFMSSDLEESYGRYRIYTVKEPEALKKLFPSMTLQEVNYLALYEDHALLAEQLPALKIYASKLMADEVWANSNEQMKWVEDEFIACNILKVIRLKNMLSQLDTSSVVGRYYKNNQKQFENYPILLSQKSIEKTGVYAALTLDLQEVSGEKIELEHHPEVALSEAETNKSSALSTFKTNLISYPKAVKNYATGQFQFMVQDEDFMLYMLKNDGVIDWKIQLQGKLVSEIFEVDVYKNNKLQYLFATDKKVYCVDRLGKIVEKYPFALAKNAVIQDLNVIDYNQSKNYRLAVSSGSNCHLYDIDAKELEDWNPKKFGSKLVGKLEHYRLDNKDFLLAIEQSGTLNLLQRRASFYEGFPVVKQNSFLTSQAVFEKGTNETNSTLTFLASDGYLKRYNLKGQSLFSEKFPITSKIDTTIVDQKTNLVRYVVKTEAKVLVFDNKLGKVFEKESNSSKLLDFQLYELSGQEIYVFVFADHTELVNKSGNMLLEFIGTNKKVSIFYSSKSKKGDLYYVNKNTLEKISFELK